MMFSGQRHGLAKFILISATIIGISLVVPTRADAFSAEQPINFLPEQILPARALYNAKCSACHGTELRGKAGPALVGPLFALRWLNGKQTFLDLFTKIQRTMPLNAPGSLSRKTYEAMVLYVLSQNGYQPTGKSFTSVDMKKFLAYQKDATAAGADDPPDPRTPFPQKPKFFGTASSDKPNGAELAHPTPGQWLMYNKGYAGQRYSRLNQINRANAASLTPVCIFQTGETGAFQTSPVIYDGVMYITTPYNTYAVNAANCQKIWENRYPTSTLPPMSVNRGVALYRGMIIRGTPSGHLIALDAKTGKLLWDTWMVSNRHGYWLSGAPIAYNGLVYMGTAGADTGANGKIEAFDVKTGKLRWTFNVIPTGKEPGAKTWGKGAERGGGSFWTSFALDRAKGELLVPVGNPAPDYRPDLRPGANLFTNSVVALDAKTGKLRWWVQQVPHDTHDWDTAAGPVIYDQNGRHYMAEATKGGWLYLYDRKTRALLAQPEISPHLNADKPLTKKGVRHCPGSVGGAEWNGPAYSPQAKALYVNSVDWCTTTWTTADNYVEGAPYLDGIPRQDPISDAKGLLHAFDAATGKSLWVRHFHTPMVAGVTPTAGGVLFTGMLDGSFLALDARSGKTLYSFNTGGAIGGAPSTYLVGKTQFVAIPSGNTSRIIWQTAGSMIVVIFARRGH